MKRLNNIQANTILEKALLVSAPNISIMRDMCRDSISVPSVFERMDDKTYQGLTKIMQFYKLDHLVTASPAKLNGVITTLSTMTEGEDVTSLQSLEHPYLKSLMKRATPAELRLAAEFVAAVNSHDIRQLALLARIGALPHVTVEFLRDVISEKIVEKTVKYKGHSVKVLTIEGMNPRQFARMLIDLGLIAGYNPKVSAYEQYFAEQNKFTRSDNRKIQ